MPVKIKKGRCGAQRYPLIEGCFIVTYFFDEWYKEIEIFMAKRYKAIVKVKNNPDGTACCVKYRVDDLIKFTQFLDKRWAGWKWFNVYSNKGMNKGEQLANFTNNKRPEVRFV